MTISPSLSPANAGYMSNLLAQSKQNIALEKELKSKNIVQQTTQEPKQSNDASFYKAATGVALAGNLLLSGILLAKGKNSDEATDVVNSSKIKTEFDKALEGLNELAQIIKTNIQNGTNITDEINKFLNKLQEIITDSKPANGGVIKLEDVSIKPFRSFDDITFLNGAAVYKAKPTKTVTGNVIKKCNDGTAILFELDPLGKIATSTKFNPEGEVIFKKIYNNSPIVATGNSGVDKFKKTVTIYEQNMPTKILKSQVTKKQGKVTDAHIVLSEIDSHNANKALMELDLSNENLTLVDERKPNVHKLLTKKGAEKPVVEFFDQPFEKKEINGWQQIKMFPLYG